MQGFGNLVDLNSEILIHSPQVLRVHFDVAGWRDFSFDRIIEVWRRADVGLQRDQPIRHVFGQHHGSRRTFPRCPLLHKRDAHRRVAEYGVAPRIVVGRPQPHQFLIIEISRVVLQLLKHFGEGGGHIGVFQVEARVGRQANGIAVEQLAHRGDKRLDFDVIARRDERVPPRPVHVPDDRQRALAQHPVRQRAGEAAGRDWRSGHRAWMREIVELGCTDAKTREEHRHESHKISVAQVFCGEVIVTEDRRALRPTLAQKRTLLAELLLLRGREDHPVARREEQCRGLVFAAKQARQFRFLARRREAEVPFELERDFALQFGLLQIGEQRAGQIAVADKRGVVAGISDAEESGLAWELHRADLRRDDAPCITGIRFQVIAEVKTAHAAHHVKLELEFVADFSRAAHEQHVERHLFRAGRPALDFRRLALAEVGLAFGHAVACLTLEDAI